MRLSNIENNENGSHVNNIFKFTNQSLTYDDLILMPGYIDFSTNEIDLSSYLTRNIPLKAPFVSSPMDTVTESDMAIALALQGGIGIIHCNNTIEDQLKHIRRVKRYCNGVIDKPVTLNANNTIQEVHDIRALYDFTSFPVVDENGKLVGYVSRGDTQFILPENLKKTFVKDVMQSNIITLNVEHERNVDMAKDLMVKHRVGRLPLVDNDGFLRGLICRKDLVNWQEYPLATRCPWTKQLLVGAAVSTHPRDRERIQKIIRDVDVIIVDSSQGNSSFQIETIKYINSLRRELPTKVDIIGGNVVTASQALNLIKAGVDGIRVGQGSGRICTTQEVCGVGRGQCSAIYYVSRLARQHGIPVIADGGISSTASITKALVLGADCVMMGGMFAGTDESPGDFIYKDGVRLKKYRGMGSKTARNSTNDGLAVKSRYHSTKKDIFVPQGVTGSVLSNGSISEYVPYISQAVKHGLQNIGCKKVKDLVDMVEGGEIRMELRSMGSQREGMVHNLYSYEK